MRLVRPSDSAALERMLQDFKPAELTYGDVGGTLTGARPDGFHHDRNETLLGQGPHAFQRAVVGLKT
jgi:uncharacterized protein (UPF0548 family)